MRVYRFGTLKHRVLGLVILASLPPYIVMVSLASQWRRHEVADTRAIALDFVRRAMMLHERELLECGWMLAALAPAARAFPERTAELTIQLEAALHGQSGRENLGIFTTDGRLLASARPWPDATPAVRRSLARAVRSALVVVEDYAVDQRSGTAMVTVAYPLRDGSGRIDRVIVRLLDLGWMLHLASDKVPGGMLLIVFDAAGEIVSQQPDSVGRPVDVLARSDRQWLIDIARRAREPGTVDAETFDGIRRTYAFAPLKDMDSSRELFLLAGFRRSWATAMADRVLTRDFIVIGLVIAAVMVSGSIAGNRWIVRHIHQLVAAAQRFGSGDMAARVGAEGRPEELAELARTFDEMADSLQARERELERERDRQAALEHRFRSMLENGTDGITLTDASGRLLYASPSLHRILGYAPEDLVGRDAVSFVHPEDRKWVDDVREQVAAQPGTQVSATCRLRRSDGTWCWIEADARNLLDDPAVEGIVYNFRDVTAYRVAQDALRASRDDLEQRVRQRTSDVAKANEALRSEIAERKRADEALQKFAQVIEQTADSVFATDLDGVIEYVNPAFEALTGYSKEEAIGQTPRLFASGRHDRQFFERLWATIKAGGVFRTIVTNRAKDGRLFEEDQTITPLLDERGTITHFISTGRDVTERRRKERAIAQLNRLLEEETNRIGSLLHDEAGQFLTSAHIMLAEIGRAVPPELGARIDEVRSHLDQVEQQLRTVSHELHPRVLEDLGLVGAIRQRAAAFGRRSGVHVTVTAAREYDLDGSARVALYRLVQEALTNIGRHAHATALAITLAEEDEWLACTIEDNGVGFEPPDESGETRPAGIGLLGMRHRVEATGGTLEIVTSRGGGTRIHARVPLETHYAGVDSHC